MSLCTIKAKPRDCLAQRSLGKNSLYRQIKYSLKLDSLWGEKTTGGKIYFFKDGGKQFMLEFVFSSF